MKKITLIYLLFFSIVFQNMSAQNTEKFYVGTFTSEGAEGIYLCSLNSEDGSIQLENTFKAIDDPTFLKVSENGKFLYVAGRSPEAVETSGGYIIAYKIQKNGNIQFINKQSSNGNGPCHVDISKDGKWVATATYNSGTTSIYPTLESGELLPATTTIQNTGTGADPERQNVPHAHSIKFSPFSNEVFSADLGTDQLNIFQIQNEKLVKGKQEFVKMDAGAGPRHFEFTKDGECIFVINELNSTITSLKKKNNNWEKFQTISTLPPSFEGESYCADIHISADGRFLYGSNRGDNSIAIFVIESNTKNLISVGTVSTEGNWPRNFVLSPDGKFMLVANQRSGNITVFSVNPQNGIPEFTGKEIKLPSPVCLEFIPTN